MRYFVLKQGLFVWIKFLKITDSLTFLIIYFLGENEGIVFIFAVDFKGAILCLFDHFITVLRLFVHFIFLWLIYIASPGIILLLHHKWKIFLQIRHNRWTFHSCSLITLFFTLSNFINLITVSLPMLTGVSRFRFEPLELLLD